MNLKLHLPSHMSIAGNDELISYDGQPPTCYRCNETRSPQLDCPRRKRLIPINTIQPRQTWADIVNNKPQEQSPVNLVYQKSPTHETGMKRINTNPVEAFDKKRPTLTQRTQEATDGMFMDSITVVNIQKGLDNTHTDNMQMSVPKEQESKETYTMLKETERMYSVPTLREGCTATVSQWVKTHSYWRHALKDQGLRMIV